MKIIIKSVTKEYNASALNYLLKRLSKFQLENFPTTSEYDELIKEYQNKKFPLAQESDFPELSEKIASRIETSKTCADNSLERDYPLLPTEKVIRNFYSYLLEPFMDVPKGCAVLRQETNFAEIYFFFEDTAIVDGKIELVPYPTCETKPLVKTVLRSSALPKFAQELAEGLLGGIGGEIGSLICNTIFQILGINYVEPLTAEMLQSIVHQELTAVEIDKINGAINGTAGWIRNVYTPLKTKYIQDPSPEKLARMNDELHRYADDLCTTAIYVLETKSFNEAGFPVYLIGVGIYISLYQELALIDPDQSKSAYIEVIKNIAKEKETTGRNNYNEIIQKRTACFTIEDVQNCTPGGPNYAGQCYYRFVWKDSYTKANGRYDYGNKGQDDRKTAEAKCNAAKNASLNEALKVLDADLGNAHSVLDAWHKLIEQALPVKA